MNRTTTITFLLLATVLTVMFSLWQGGRTARLEYNAAAIGVTMRPSSFAINSTSISCVNAVPHVSLAWSESQRANNYVISRMYPWGGSWEIVGETTQTQFSDDTYEPGYDFGDFQYRIQANNDSGSKFSPNAVVTILDCAGASSTPVTLPSALLPPAPAPSPAPTPAPTPSPVVPPPPQTPNPTPTPVVPPPAPVTLPPAPSPVSTPTPSPVVALPSAPVPLPVPPPASTPVSTKFSTGSRIYTVTTLNVRQVAGTVGQILAVKPPGAQGTVVGGPTYANNFVWWNVDYDTGIDGWSIENYLSIFSSVSPTPAPVPTPVPPPTPLPQPTPTPTPVVPPPAPIPVTTLDSVSPSTPAGLSASSTGQTEVALSWVASTDNVGVTGYKIYRCVGTSCSATTQIGTSSSSRFINIIGLTPSTNYRYRVRAFDAVGNTSGYSSHVSATTLAAPTPTPAPSPVPPPPSIDATLPTTPTALIFSTVAQTSITLSWSASTDNIGVSGYKIFRCQGVGCTPTNQVGTSTALTYQSMNLTAGTVQYYRIRAYDAAGNVSAYTSTISTTTLAQAVTPLPSPTPTPTPTPVPSPSPASLEWGAYTGSTPSSLASFESIVGKQANLQSIFVGWGNTIGSFPSEFKPTVADKGKTLVIFWEPTDGSGSLTQPSYNYASIVSGTWDSYMSKFASDAKAYGGPIILVPYHEMNGNWDPWDGTVNGNSPATFIAAWKHTKDLFASATNVKFAWGVNNESVPNTSANAIGMYWPGSAYVDYVGIDGFNFGTPWQTFSNVFDSAVSQVSGYGKPIYILSVASADSSQKPAWITDGLGTKVKNIPNIKGWIWFNENKEQNWLVNSTQAALDAFRAILP